MPAKAGIQVRSWSEYKNRLDSGMRRNDGNRSRLPVDKFRTPRLVAEGCSVCSRFSGGGDITFAEAIESHRVVVEHFSFEFFGYVFAGIEVRQIAAELIPFALVRKIGSPHNHIVANQLGQIRRGALFD